jgi:hypothetical protein
MCVKYIVTFQSSKFDGWIWQFLARFRGFRFNSGLFTCRGVGAPVVVRRARADATDLTSYCCLIYHQLTGEPRAEHAQNTAELPIIPGGLNWSVQHHLEVYLPEFESPKFVAGVD